MKHILQATIISFILLLTSVYGNNDSSIETPQIITPLEKELLKKSTEILYSWDKSESHTNYFFSLYDKGLKKIVYVKKQLIAEDICEGSICSYKPDVILTDDKMHRWYLRAYNDKESTSTIFTDFYVGKYEELVTPKIISPAANSIINKTKNIEFSWEQDLSATQYTFFIYDQSKKKIVDKKYNMNVGDICKNKICRSISTVALGESSNHAWYIRSSNRMKKSSMVTSYFNVATSKAPSTPDIISPKYNDEVLDNRNIEFHWKPDTKTESYSFRIYDSVKKEIVLNMEKLSKYDICTATECFYKPNIVLKNSKNHIWYLRASNGAGDSSFLSTIFTVNGPNLFTPENFRITKTAAGFIEMQWDEAENATGYIFNRDGEYYETVNGKTIFRDTKVIEGKIYSYEMSAYKDGKYAPRTEKIRAMAIVSDSEDDKPDSSQLPADIKNNYEISFYDEFNNPRLNLSKWNTKFIWGPEVIINNEEQYYIDTLEEHQNLGVNPFGFKNGSLTIFANKTPQSLLSKTKNQKYTSGIITSRDSFNFTHGYAEARVKIPAGQGLWPAFWLLNTKYEGMKPEIDIMENLGHETNKVHQTYHYYDSTGKLISNESHVQGSIDYSEGYHTFAVQWEPGLIQYYIDGKKTKKIEGPGVASQDMYVLANLAVGGNWPKSPDATTNFPAQFAIDYIRVYEKK